jgi:type III restriction enzyme
MKPEDARKKNIELHINGDQLARKEFKELWNRINAKSVYTVKFDTRELIDKAIEAINRDLTVSQVYFTVTQGVLAGIKSKDELQNGDSFKITAQDKVTTTVNANASVKYDLVGKIVDETGLTRKTIVAILKGISPIKFSCFSQNPEEFILKISTIINEQKATAIVEYIEYKLLDAHYDTAIFTEPTLKGSNDAVIGPLGKHLFDYLLTDSKTERSFARELETQKDVTVYVKLPNTFYINTPVGKYNPDWAIAFKEGAVKHIYFVAETKGSMSSLELREIEAAKIACARKHFAKIGIDLILYDKVDNYKTLLDKVMR